MKKSKASVDRTLSEIIATALEVFSKRGYTATNLQDISQALGITRTPLYYHFKNKRNLYEKVVEDLLLKKEETIKDIYFSPDLGIFAKTSLHLQRFCEYGLIEAALFMGIEDLPEMAAINRLRRKSSRFIYEAKLKFVKESIASGELKPETDPETFVRHTYVLYYGLMTMVSRADYLHKLSVKSRNGLIEHMVRSMELEYSPSALTYSLLEPVYHEAPL